MPEIELGPGRLTRKGVGWFVGLGLSESLPQAADDVSEFLESTVENARGDLEASSLADTVDSSVEGDDRLLRLIEEAKRDPYRAEHWIGASLVEAVAAQRALKEDRSDEVAFRMANLGYTRTMWYFHANLEDVVWRGYQAYGLKELHAAVRIWQDNQSNGDEEFWQTTFSEHPFLLTQLAAGPAAVVGEKVYVGGKTLGNTGGKLADFLIENNLSGGLGLVELKTPCTELLHKGTYRGGIYGASRDLAGAVAQVLSYRRSLLDEWRKLLVETPDANAIHPRCYVIAGQYSTLADDASRRESFELFRNALHDVEVITFDELFARAEGLLGVIAT